MPHCDAYSAQPASPVWRQRTLSDAQGGLTGGTIKEDRIVVRVCYQCVNVCVWFDSRLVYPNSGAAPLPNLDLPDDIKNDYLEASTILSNSPRAAADLLRLCIQKLCKYLGESGKDINKDIGELVKKGLPVQIQRALGIVRVVGNESVHPDTLVLTTGQQLPPLSPV